MMASTVKKASTVYETEISGGESVKCEHMKNVCNLMSSIGNAEY